MAKGRPSKPIELVKSHRSTAEKKARAEAESQLLTGVSLQENSEVKDNPIAHKEFLRLRKLLKIIGKDDDLSGHVINQHCILVAECKELEKVKAMYIENLEKFEERSLDEPIMFTDKMKILMGMQKAILDTDKALMAKRKMLLDIGKENILTIASALRSIPKKPQDEGKEDPMAKFLSKRV